jgi:hypothetical protein
MNSSIYQLADTVTCRQTNKDLKMLFDRNRGVMYELNETASDIVTLLNETPSNINQIVQALSEIYDAPLEEIKADAEQFINDFSGAGLIVPVSQITENAS